MKTIAVSNHKGGVGKTTTVFNMGSELSKRGYKVVMVDFDMQGNLSTICGIPETYDNTIYKAIEMTMDGKDISQEPVKIKDNLYIWPCNLAMGSTIIKINASMGSEKWLKFTLDNLKKHFDADYILIDCAPSIMVDFQNALVAADEVIIVANPTKLSTDGIISLMTQYRNIKKYLDKPNLKIAGILMNRVDLRTNYTKVMIDYSEEVFKELNIFKTLIPTSVKVDECILLNNYIGDCLPNNPVAKAYKLFVDEYLENNNMEVKAV